MKYLWITIGVFVTLMILPPVIHGYIYPTAGDDTVVHLYHFLGIGYTDTLYHGQDWVGNILSAIPVSYTTSFLWFHYVVLALIVLTVGLTTAKAVNWFAGILAIISVLAISQLLNLFYYGQIFDLIGIALLLPVALMGMSVKNIYWNIAGIGALGLFAFFHANGAYIIALVPIIMVYEVVRKKYRIKGYFKRVWKNRFIMWSGLLGLALALLNVLGFSSHPSRLIMDGSILLAIAVAGIVGILVRVKGYKVAVVGVALLICIPNLVVWMQDNSAVKQVDKDALVYLNSVGPITFTANPNVEERIYSLYSHETFINDVEIPTTDVDYIVIRNVPMTPTSDPDAYYFDNFDRIELERYLGGYNFRIVKQFNTGEKDKKTGEDIIVQIYKNTRGM